MSTAPITIFLNGRAHQVPSGSRIPDLLASHHLSGRRVLVEINETAILPAEWSTTEVIHGDRVEFIRVVAGG